MRLTPLDDSYIKDLYINKRMPAYKISELCNCAKATILDHLKKLNIPRRAAGFQKGNQYGNKTKGIKHKPHTEETKRKMSTAHKGKVFSEIHRKHLSEASKGEKNWKYGKHLSAEHRRAISNSQKGRKFTLVDRIKLSAGWRHIPLSEWKGFTHPEQLRFRGSEEYREWKKAVLKRDNYQCQSCGKRGGKLHGHHIKDFSIYPELRLEVSNGITLCKPCHDVLHTGRPKLRSVEMLKHQEPTRPNMPDPKLEKIEVSDKEE